jgi:hypothetical protein
MRNHRYLGGVIVRSEASRNTFMFAKQVLPNPAISLSPSHFATSSHQNCNASRSLARHHVAYAHAFLALA